MKTDQMKKKLRELSKDGFPVPLELQEEELLPSRPEIEEGAADRRFAEFREFLLLVEPVLQPPQTSGRDDPPPHLPRSGYLGPAF